MVINVTAGINIFR